MGYPLIEASGDRVKIYHRNDAPSTTRANKHGNGVTSTPNYSTNHREPEHAPNCNSSPSYDNRNIVPGTLERFLPRQHADADPDVVSIDKFVVKVVDEKDERASKEDFKDAKRREVDGLNLQGLRTLATMEKVPCDAIVLGGRFIHTLENYGRPSEKAKVRFVAQRFNDCDKPYIVHDTATLRASSVRTILSSASYHNFSRLLSQDITQAYLQSRRELTRKVFVRVRSADKNNFGLKENEVLLLKKPGLRHL